MEPCANYYAGMSLGKRVVTVLTESFVMIGRLLTGKSASA